MVTCTVRAGHAGSVEHKCDTLFVQGNIHENLIKRTVHKRRVDGNHRVQSTERHSGCRSNSVLFCDANVEDPVRKLFCEWREPDRIQHCACDSDKSLVVFGQADEFAAKHFCP